MRNRKYGHVHKPSVTDIDSSDSKLSNTYKSRRGGFKMILRGLFCILILTALYFLMQATTVIYEEGWELLAQIIYSLGGIASLITAIFLIQIPLGLYYLIRYFNVTD